MSSRRVAIGAYCVVVTLAVLLLAAVPGLAQAKKEIVPDVLVLVFSGATPNDIATMTYNSLIPKDQALIDLKELVKTTGWKITKVNLTNEPAKSGGPKLTAIDFEVQNHAVDWNTGILLVEPFAVTFKRFNTIQVNYLLQGTLPFKSLRDYTDRYVDIGFNMRRGTYSYTIRIKDHGFDKLNLPLIVKVDENGGTKEASRSHEGGSGRSIWLALLIALIAAGFAYFAASRASRNTKGAVEP